MPANLIRYVFGDIIVALDAETVTRVIAEVESVFEKFLLIFQVFHWA